MISSLEPDSPLPLYAQLADLLRARINGGEWATGARLPSIQALTHEFGVARVTVRQAVVLLAREGVLAPRQGRGTFVTAQPGAGRRLAVKTTLTDLVEMLKGLKPRLLTIEERHAAPTLRDGDGAPAPRYVYMRRVHLRGDQPYCIVGMHIAEHVFRQAPKRFRNEVAITVFTSLRDTHVATARQTLTIGAADAETARLLGLPLHAPVGLVRRLFRDAAGVVFYLGEVTYRGDVVELDMELVP